MRKTELLIPAGSLDVLKTAVVYGADAVYIGGEAFGLRAKAHNFSNEEMKQGIAFAHARGVKVYVTANILAHNGDLPGVEAYFEELGSIRPDALIISDPGVFAIARRVLPDMDIHISTQANNTNYGTYLFWHQMGAARVVSARELSLAEIKEIRAHIPEEMEIETFIHGAMCISYSGRCLLSNFFTGRDANQGACTHPCRWKYSIVEETRPGEYMPVYENERGTFIFNSKDLCMIGHIPEMIDAGIDSFKIEGRMKQPGYTAGVTSVYRKYLDLLFEKGAENYRVAEEDKRYLLDLFNRGGSCTGYYQMQNGPSMMAFSNEKKTGDVSPVLRKKKEKIQGTFILFPGSPAILDVSCRGIHGFASVGEVQYAQNQPLTEERIRSQMEKLGNTEYEWENLEIQMDENIFIPMKMLNEARRETLESLENELLKPYKREENNGKKRLSEDAGRKADSPKQKNLPIYISCEEKSTALALYKREGIHGMYLNADAMEVCLDDCVSRGMEMYLSLPHIMRGEMPRELLIRIREWMDRGMTGFLVRNLETFAVLRKAGLAEKCVLDHSMYTWNDEAADFWKDQKVLRNTVPLELNEGEIRHRDNRDSEMLIYGYLPLMISAQCVHKNLYGCNHKEEGVTLKDRYDKEFTAKCICNPWKTENTDFCIPCYNIIYNSIPYGLLKEKSQIDRLGVSSLRLAFTIEKPQDAVKIYEEFRAVYRDGKNPPKREYTKGHFKRGAE